MMNRHLAYGLLAAAALNGAANQGCGGSATVIPVPRTSFNRINDVCERRHGTFLNSNQTAQAIRGDERVVFAVSTLATEMPGRVTLHVSIPGSSNTSLDLTLENTNPLNREIPYERTQVSYGIWTRLNETGIQVALCPINGLPYRTNTDGSMQVKLIFRGGRGTPRTTILVANTSFWRCSNEAGNCFGEAGSSE